MITALGVWWLLASVAAPAGTLLARFGPGEALPALVDFLTSGIGVSHTADTVRRLLLGLGTAIVAGIAVGVTVGLSRTAGEATSGVFQFLRMVSPLAWTPIAVAAFGIGDPPVFFLVAVAAVWPVILSTAAGVEQVDPGWVAVARSLNATRFETVRHVFLPAIRGHIGTGIRLALGTAWIVIVPAEMLGVDSGLGYAILDARDRLDYPELMAVIIWIGVLGTILDLGVRRATRPRLNGKPAPSPSSGPANSVTRFSQEMPA
ncbi:MAG: ABC transporter permease [Acidimicrobiia bacterium]